MDDDDEVRRDGKSSKVNLQRFSLMGDTRGGDFTSREVDGIYTIGNPDTVMSQTSGCSVNGAPKTGTLTFLHNKKLARFRHHGPSLPVLSA